MVDKTIGAWITFFTFFGVGLLIVGIPTLIVRLIYKFYSNSDKIIKQPKWYKKFQKSLAQKLMITSVFGAIWELIQNLFTVSFLAVFFYEIQEGVNVYSLRFQLIASIFFFLEYLLKFMVANKKLNYYISLYAIIDFATFMPSILTYVENTYGYEISENWVTPNDAIWYMVVTTTSVGYGDEWAYSTQGKYLMIIVILGTIVIIPIELGKLSGLLSTSLMLSSYTSTKESRHIILCGDIGYSTVLTFCDSFYSRAIFEYTILILDRNEPNKELTEFLQHPMYKSKVKWVLGNSIDIEDLKRVSITTCSGVFILADQYSSNQSETDLKNIMRLLSILDQNSKVPVFLQSLSQQTIVQSENFGVSFPLEINQLKLFLIGRNSCLPGFSTFLSNLISPTTFQIQKNDPQWKSQYLYGAIQNLYCVLIPHGLKGKSFDQVVKLIYNETSTHILVLGTLNKPDARFDDVNSKNTNNPFIIKFNPKVQALSENTRLIVIAKSPLIIVKEFKKYDDELNLHYVTSINFRDKAHDKDKISNLQSDSGSDSGSDSDSDSHSGSGSGSDSNSNPEEKKKKKKSDQKKNQKTKFKTLNVKNKNNKFQRVQTTIQLLSKEQYYNITDNKPTLENILKFHNLKRLKNHIIISGCNNSSLFNLISTLRCKEFGNKTQILILTKTMTKEEWNEINHFPNLFVYFGKLENADDLQKINIYSAKQIIFLNSPEKVKKLSNDKDMGDFYVDSEIIFKVRSIQSIQFESFLICEIIHEQNLKFLKPESISPQNDLKKKRQLDLNEFSYQLNPNFISSSVFMPSVIDTIFSLALTSLDVLNVVIKLIFGSTQNSATNNDEPILFVIKIPDNYFGIESIIKGNKKRNNKKKKNSNNSDQKIINPITYSQLFNVFIKPKVQLLPVAVYRNSSEIEQLKKNNSYLLTNPHPDTRIYPNDQIFIFGTPKDKIKWQKKVKLKECLTGSSESEIEDIQIQDDLDINDELKKKSDIELKLLNKSDTSEHEELLKTDLELTGKKEDGKFIERSQFRLIKFSDDEDDDEDDIDQF
ncbi:potassium large conductance calcium-activated channel subfamily m alpha member 1a [Anaeramoeba flamelloides]|uniref:Potassium large conductance calcium-activated channel subfamily m alpha member 1a n=1 Tax=Anaeramoeba flamelloides TaxID=1746091 RepID=A0AAV7ZW81_9EUKA|nr:potassium large conductance calcium-activated channel subfamily m alpha member 1a [Anaeramoeba flamelloides]